MPLSDEVGHAVGRRQFGALVVGWIGMVGGLAGTAYASVRTLFPNVLFEPSRRLTVGRPEDFNEPSVTFLEAPRFFIIREEHTLRAVSAVCTHLGCTINQDPATGGYLCPCHGSAFDALGAVTDGPAPAPLACYALSLAPDGRVVVDMDRHVSPHARLELERV